MPLSDDLMQNFSASLEKIVRVACEKAGKLTSANMKAAVTKYDNSFVVDSKINVEKLSGLVTIENSINSVDPVLIVAEAETASMIADMMMGIENPDPNFEGSKHDAFKNAIVQSAKAAVESFSELTSAGMQLTEAKFILLDPENEESLNLAVDPDRYMFELKIEVQGAGEHSIYVDISSQNINTLLSLFETSAQSAAAGQETVGDFMGTDFGEIIDSHNPDDVDPSKNLNLLMDIRLGLIVELGRSEMHLRDILKLTKGSIIELDRLSGEPVDLFVNNKLIARGEVVVIDDNFGLRINQLAGNNKKEKKLLSGGAQE